VETVDVPVLANGGITCLAEARTMMQETGAAGVMIATGAFGNPWLLRQVLTNREDPPEVEERFQVMQRHLALAVAHMGVRRGVRRMRSHLAWYFKGLPEAARHRLAMVHIDDPQLLATFLDDYRRRVVEWQSTD